MKRNIPLHKAHFVPSLAITACAVLLALANQRALHAQQNTPAKTAVATTPQTTAVPSAAKPAAEDEKTAKPDKPGSIGIKVHGHWVMDIKNPDGTLVKHLDFQNSLTTGGGTTSSSFSTGDQLLVALLSGSAVPADPGIFLVGFQPSSAKLPAGADITNLCIYVTSSYCGVVTTSQSFFSGDGGIPGIKAVEKNLVTTANFSPTVNWVLSGNFTIPAGMTSLTMVQVWLPVCAPSSVTYIDYSRETLQGSTSDGGAALVTPSYCTTSGKPPFYLSVAIGPMTSTLVPNAPQTLVPGQIIQVTVTLSFS
jgi:hypothetical protein